MATVKVEIEDLFYLFLTNYILLKQICVFLPPNLENIKICSFYRVCFWGMISVTNNPWFDTR